MWFPLHPPGRGGAAHVSSAFPGQSCPAALLPECCFTAPPRRSVCPDHGPVWRRVRGEQREAAGHAERVSFWLTGLAGDRQEREEPQLHPGRDAAAADGRRALPPAERHGVRPHGEGFSRDVQVRRRQPGGSQRKRKISCCCKRRLRLPRAWRQRRSRVSMTRPPGQCSVGHRSGECAGVVRDSPRGLLAGAEPAPGAVSPILSGAAVAL